MAEIKKETPKKEAPKELEPVKFNKKTVRKIGSVPHPYDDDSIVFIEDGKIYIAKKN